MPTKRVIIIKFGGSVITKKISNRPQIRGGVILRLTRELKQFIQRSSQTKIILLHGAGSFGHPLVYRYHLLKPPFTSQRLLGYVKTIQSTRRLTNLLAASLQAAKLPVWPLQTSAMVGFKRETMVFFNLSYIKQILSCGFIPLLGGDLVLTHRNQPAIASADNLAVLLARAFPSSKIIFATDVNGVFYEFPPVGNTPPIPSLSRKNLRQLIKQMKRQENKYDMTGGMFGKLQTLLQLRKREVIIFNGLRAKTLLKALSEQPIGTRLHL